jgi:hypothetical protein
MPLDRATCERLASQHSQKTAKLAQGVRQHGRAIFGNIEVVHLVQISAGGTAEKVGFLFGNSRHPAHLIIVRFVDCPISPSAPGLDPVNPCLQITRWKKKTATGGGVQRRQIKFAETPSDISPPLRNALTILVKQTENSMTFAKALDFSHRFNEFSLYPVVPGTLSILSNVDFAGIDVRRFEKAPREPRVPPSLTHQDDAANPAHSCSESNRLKRSGSISAPV